LRAQNGAKRTEEQAEGWAPDGQAVRILGRGAN
jgi:hypothetical protein